MQQDITVQENALSILTGVLPKAIARINSLNNIVLADALFAGVPSSLVANRPDVKSYELAINIANANTGIAKANMYPSLTITAAAGGLILLKQAIGLIYRHRFLEQLQAALLNQYFNAGN